MSRIAACIASRREQAGKLLIPYLVAGDPNLKLSLALMHGLVAAGADIIELGVPFSDPSSDGAVIQQGSERALAQGTSLKDVLQLVTEFRQTNDSTPVVLMGYLNPVEIMGYEAFARAAAKAGVDGVLLVDLPPREAQPLAGLLKDAGIDTIFLVAPTTSAARVKTIVDACSGYLYYVSLKGVTGAAITDSAAIAESIQALRQQTRLPIVIGFGIKTPDNAVAMAAASDGVVIGSALVARIGELADSKDPTAQQLADTVSLIADSRRALDNSK